VFFTSIAIGLGISGSGDDSFRSDLLVLRALPWQRAIA
jgi:hypothetical protein